MAKTIRVIHTTHTNEQGVSKLVRASKETIEPVKAHYIGGAVLVGSGDVWDTAADPKGKADYVSRLPN